MRLALYTRAIPASRHGRLRRSLSDRVVAARQPGRGNGPNSVLASLLRGLAASGSVRHVLNAPPRGDVAVVLSDLAVLEQAIAWRRSGRIRRLLAGPNLVVHPTDAAELMAAEEIDVHLVPSAWVRDLYAQDLPALGGRVAVWPAGVDPDWWSRTEPHADRRDRVLVYVKDHGGTAPLALHEAADASIGLLQERGIDVAVIRYGDYTPAQFRTELARSRVAVFFSATESQGIALAEAWSMDVPTLVWEHGRYEHRGRSWPSTSAPYLTPATGTTFRTVDELGPLLLEEATWRSDARPRSWVLEHMTDELSARTLLELAFPGPR